MNKRPNEILHMIAWGFLGGLLVCMTYTAIVYLFPQVFFITFIWLMAIQIAALPGAFIGFLLSLFLWHQLRQLQYPITMMELREKRLLLYSVTFIFTGLSYSFVLWLFFQDFLRDLTEVHILLRTIVPVIIASITATVAVQHYLLRLQKWNKSFDTRKSKRKNDDYYRLMDDEEITDYTAHDSHTSSQESRS